MPVRSRPRRSPLLAADPRRGADGPARAEAKVVSGLTGLLPEDVLPRVHEQFRRERRWVLGAATAAVCLVAGMALGSWYLLGRHVDQVVQATTETGRKVDATNAKLDELVRAIRQAGIVPQAEAAGTTNATAGPEAREALPKIRDLLRPGNPDIDRLTDEQLLQALPGMLKALLKPAPVAEDFADAVKRALQESQARIGSLAFSCRRCERARRWSRSPGPKRKRMTTHAVSPRCWPSAGRVVPIATALPRGGRGMSPDAPPRLRRSIQPRRWDTI